MLERQIGDLIADGRITNEDAAAVRAFRDFLAETPGHCPTVADFPDRAAFEAWRARWLPYVAGLADGPSTPEEWPAYRERITSARGGVVPDPEEIR